MIKKQVKLPNMSLDWWNLDFLSLRELKKNPFPGSITTCNLTPLSAISGRNRGLQLEIIHRDGTPVLVSLNPATHQLQYAGLPPPEQSPEQSKIASPNMNPMGSKESLATIFTHGETVYGLNPPEETVYEYIKGTYEPDRQKIYGSPLPVECKASLLFPTYFSSQAPYVVVVAAGNEVWVSPFGGALHFERKELHILNASKSASSLGGKLTLCADNLKKTILIADSDNHRVLELNPFNATATVLCGTGKPGKAQDGDDAHLAYLHDPIGLAILRPNQFVKDRVDKPSMDILTADPTAVLPRTIVIAERSNNRLIRLIEMPGHRSGWKSVPESAAIFSLLGSGEAPVPRYHVFEGQAKNDLRTYRIAAPGVVHQFGHGELLIQVEEGAIILSPSSAERERKTIGRAPDPYTS